MRQELDRSMQTLKRADAPFFLSYEITESYSASVRGAYGTINTSGDDQGTVSSGRSASRHAEVRQSRTRGRRMGAFSFYERFNLGAVPLDDDATAVRRALLVSNDHVYKDALEQLRAAKAGRSCMSRRDTSPISSLEPPAVHREVRRDVRVDRAAWEKRSARIRRRSRATPTSSRRAILDVEPKRAGT